MSEPEETNSSSPNDLPIGKTRETNTRLPGELSMSELEETNSSSPNDLPIGKTRETNTRLPGESVDKDHLWVICKVDKLDRDRFSCWTGSFKQGFTSDLEKAQTYQEKSLNRIAHRIANSEHAADTSKESILCKTLWDLKKMTAAIAVP